MKAYGSSDAKGKGKKIIVSWAYGYTASWLGVEA